MVSMFEVVPDDDSWVTLLRGRSPWYSEGDELCFVSYVLGSIAHHSIKQETLVGMRKMIYARAR